MEARRRLVPTFGTGVWLLVAAPTASMREAGDMESMMESLILLFGLVILVAILVGTWKRGRRRQADSTSRMQQDIHTFHENLHDAPGRSRPGRYRGPGQGWR